MSDRRLEQSAHRHVARLACVAPEYTIREKPLGSAKHIRIVAIGAGVSGMNLIRTLRLNLTDYDLVVYEKNEDVGGTWFENRYPGARCDIPSHSYQYSWRPKHDWTNFCSPAEEIEGYLRQVCLEENMQDSIKTSHQVVSAQWNETRGIWNLEVQNLETGKVFTDFANFLINGSGILNDWKWPDVPDLSAFEGELIHSARWPSNFDHSNKVIAVIGNGSTGVQVLPELQPEAKKIYHIIRTPTWITPPRLLAWKLMGQASEVLDKIQLDEEENFSQDTIEKFKSDPNFYRAFVKGIEVELNKTLSVVDLGSPVHAFAQKKVTEYMTAMLCGDERLCKALIPTFPLGCRRLTPGHSYLQALTKPNVDVKLGGIRRFVPEGIELESGEILKVDAIVCATGFDTSFRPRFPVIGRSGNLQDKWERGAPKAYMSCAVAGMPNYFTFFGPNAPIGHGSVFTLSEHVAKYITGVIKKCQTEGIKALSPSRAAVDDYFEHISAFMPRTAWAAGGRSWFKNGRQDGPVTALHPGSRAHFFRMLARFRAEDFEYVYDDENPTQNRFAYLGNGYAMEELVKGADTTWYLDAPATVIW
ncbi:hypothetical protein B0T19DRAFT_437312 [Cercophora scortea]|uniref:Sterigmatocystin biosynthesis monooxygenase stcW n=1 Tax=Cercophora scortea TaxID=314031 RepID=A0AAE0MLI2_9PEZI|nr:hypothetical protein B0T19DRAFT_437312 [Cercophora scortea]